MATATLEPTPPAATAVPAPEKSFFNDDLDAEFQRAIDRDSASKSPEDKGKSGEVAAPAAATVTPPKPEATTQTDEMPGDIKSEAGQSSWKRLKESKATVEKERDTIRGERDSAVKERDGFKTRISELEAAAKTPAQQAKLEDNPEYKQLKELAEARSKELEDYSERLRLVNVEQHPKFQAYFKAKTDAQMNIAKQIGGEKLLEALQLPNGETRTEKLKEIIVEMDEFQRLKLGPVLTRLDEIQFERDSEIAQAKESYQKILAEQQQAQEKDRRSIELTFKQITDEVTSKEKGLSVFHERDGDAEWNSGVKERLAVAQAAFAGKLKAEDLMRNAYWGAAAPVLLTELNGARATIASLEKQLGELRAAAPAPGGERPGDGDTKVPIGLTGLDALMHTMEQEGAMSGRR